MEFSRALGLGVEHRGVHDPQTLLSIHFRLAMLGLPRPRTKAHPELEELTAAFAKRQVETQRLLADYLCPADQRIQDFLNDYLRPTGVAVSLPARTFTLDRHGLARALSLPAEGDAFVSDLVSSYRVRQGVLHNPRSDRRTTQGIFHVADGGLPVPDDKRITPRAVYARLLERALRPPPAALALPFTSGQDEPAECFVSLLLRPLVCPAVPGFTAEKTCELRFFAPGGLVSNLDFVESIFGNAGDPFLPEHDAGLDVEHWTGHTGCVILAPHLTRCTKAELGLPHWDQATERQRADEMCWRDPAERYNNGVAFKVTARDARGVMVTLIADNYFGYCKKEVKTQISFAANLHGLAEEEHAGGALVYPSYDLGEEFSGHLHVPRRDHNFEQMIELYGAVMDVDADRRYGVDKQFPDIIYVPEGAHFDLLRQTVSWPNKDGRESLRLRQGKTYVRPSGYRVHMEKPAPNRVWRLVGTVAEPTLCHKPCTVSGGGKSEISKAISDAILQGPAFIADFQRDLAAAAEIMQRDFGDRFRVPAEPRRPSRPALSVARSLGSVIKLLTPADEYTAAYNAWLNSIPQHIKELVFVIKRCYRPEWGRDWRQQFGVDLINGTPGNELKFNNRKIVTTYLRVGYDSDGSWRTFGLRQDFHPAQKLQVEDDITVSVVAPVRHLKQLPGPPQTPAVKFVKNCEYRLFQRPDDAVHRGYDRQTEADFARPGNFFSNYEPLTVAQARDLCEDAISLDQYTPPLRELLTTFAREGRPDYIALTSQPRLVDGQPTKNPRYLQTRPDLVNPRAAYLAEMCTRLYRRVPLDQPVLLPVNAVLPGRRNNPPDPGAHIRPLAVFNPIHYLELPELFMEFICSLTGKSPSTTGAGSEGALTKGPFNALPPIIDLNNALVGYLLTGGDVFITAAGHVGPKLRVDHDISLLVPELWSRMSPAERDPRFLIEQGYLERCADFVHNGQPVLASRLGHRITMRFVLHFFGRLFNHPHVVCTDEMLRPETQDLDVFADGLDNIVTTQRQIAEAYFRDGSVADACPPLRALLHIMRAGAHEGRDLNHPEIRALFTLENLLASDWYAARLRAKQTIDAQTWRRHVAYLEAFLTKPNYAAEALRLRIADRLRRAAEHLAWVESDAYREFLHGSSGAHPLNGG